MTTHIPRTGPSDLRAILDDAEGIVDVIAATLTHTDVQLDQARQHLHATVAFVDRTGRTATDYIATAADGDQLLARWAALRAALLAVTAPHLQVAPLLLPASRTKQQQRAPLPPVLLPVLRLAAQRGRERSRIVGLAEAGATGVEMTTLSWDEHVRSGWPPTIDLPGSSRIRPRQTTVHGWAAGHLERTPDHDGPIFTGRNGQAATPTAVSQPVVATADGPAGLTHLHVSVESIRTTIAATVWEERGLRDAADFLGIGSPQRTRDRLQPAALTFG